METPDKPQTQATAAPMTAVGGDDVESVTVNDLGQTVVRIRGRAEPFVEVRVARCFPWSIPDAYISIMDKDGKEIVLLKDLEELSPDARRVVEAELRDKVFSPRIRRVLSCKSDFGVVSITALTDRGEVTFQIRTRDDIRILSARQALFRDADGITYELEDLHSLDPISVKYLQDFF